ncbi:hypothetical protein Tco_1029379 [Tanacetum coccineum]|uniref:Uncharacterized protein n=1 Tax=Tanacetum coccineum TaxID=301880 RepID=A0ABQ5G395_9ASTR
MDEEPKQKRRKLEDANLRAKILDGIIATEIKALTIELDKAHDALKPFKEELFTHQTELLAESEAKEIISRKIASLDIPLDDDASIYIHRLLAESEKAIQIAEQHIERLTETMKPFNHKEIAQTNRQIEQTRIQVESRDAMLLMLEKWLKKSKKEKLEVTSCLDCASSRHYPVDVELLS